MYKTLMLIATLVLCLPALAHAQGTNPADEAAVRQAVEHYFAGWKNSDPLSMKRAFHPKARFFLLREGTLVEYPVESVYTAMRKNKRYHLPVKDVLLKILAVEVTGDLASVKLELEYPPTKGSEKEGARINSATSVEQLSLLRFQDGWRIVSKVDFARFGPVVPGAHVGIVTGAHIGRPSTK
jgi:hypothetical protein